MSEEGKKSSYSNDFSAVSESRRSWSWRKREGLGESEGEINMETLEILCEAQEKRDDESVGLSSQEALKRLFDAIKDELSTYMEANSCAQSVKLPHFVQFNEYI